MVLDFVTLTRKVAVLGVAALATVALAFPLSAHLRADFHSEKGSREHLEKAIALQPGNAELRNRLGRLLLYSPLENPAAVIRQLETATHMDPRAGQYWMDLALAQELNGNLPAASASLARARAAEPRTPALLWHEANFLVRRGQNVEALEKLQALLADAPEYTVRALAFFGNVADASLLIEQAIPRQRSALEAAMEFIRRENKLAAAPVLWKAVSQLAEAPAPGPLRLVVDWLINAREVDLARKIWSESGQRGWLPVVASESPEQLYNAQFERPLQNFGFDWRVLPHPETSAWIEARGPSPGLLSLCIQFSHEARSDFRHVTHAIAVAPNSQYVLRAALRSERLASQTGARLTLLLAGPGQTAVQTDSVAGTSHWKEVLARMQTGAQANLAYLQLARPAPAKDEEPGSGLVCMADVRWQKIGATPSPAAVSR